MSNWNKWLLSIAGSIIAVAGVGYIYRYWLRRRKIGVISKLIVYPVKSCRGIEVDEALCTPYGLAHSALRDRQFMVADTESGEFISARTYPSIVLVRCSLDSDANCLLLDAPNMTQLQIDLTSPRLGQKTTGTVFSSSAEAFDCGTEASDWFTKYLKCRATLLFFEPLMCDRKVEPTVGQAYNRQSRPKEDNAVTMFSDGYPYLICNDKSVGQVNTDIGSEVVTWRNFRPNILVSDTKRAYDEDEWRALEVNDIKFFCEKPCGRCRLPNVNPSTGVVNPRAEPYNTLRKTRMLRNYDEKSPMFGVNLILDSNDGIIRVGDSLFSS
ncbi:mitochondrial amidoxime reducing component 2-like [Watersipora subatra]|uniref:mitochondrial amidoxime reducing component 2-like n=1 Tax=Watersipora subatra TaxID=2589382 RepID=UPI00355C5916